MRTNLKTLMCLALLGAGIAAGLARVEAQAPASQVETVATLPSGGAENIAQAADGSIFITGMADKVLYKVRPGGGVEQFASVPAVYAVLGVVPTPDGGALVTAWERAMSGNPPDLTNLGSQILVLDKAGTITATLHGEKGTVFNGIDAVGKGLYLVADMSGTVWQVDPAQKRLERWLSDPLLVAQPFGANGIKVHNGWVYVSVTGKSAMYRIQMDANGRPQGSPTLLAEGVRVDDFDVAADGTVYAPSGDAMYKISATGTVGKVAEKVTGGPASLVSSDGRWLYWVTRGGGRGGGPATATLLRIAIP